jgi:phosphinothricin acetyltransferase
MTVFDPRFAVTTKAGELSVRPATVSDMDRKMEILASNDTETKGGTARCPATKERTTNLFRAAIDKGYPYLVGEIDGRVVAYTYLRDYNDEPHTAELSLYVDHNYLYRGIGSRLLEKLFDVLQHPDRYDGNWMGAKKRGDERRITSVIATAHINPEGREGGEGLPRFYERLSFDRIARLEKVAKRGDQL